VCAVLPELGRHLGYQLPRCVQFALDHVLLGLEGLDFLTLALARVVGGQAVALDTLDATLLLLVLGFGALARRQVGFGFGKDLAPRLALLGGLGGSIRHWGADGGRG